MTPAYYLSWTSEWRKPIRAELRYQDEHDNWRTILSFDVRQFHSERRRLLAGMIIDRTQHLLDDDRIAHIVDTFDRYLRITVDELDAALAHPIQQSLL